VALYSSLVRVLDHVPGFIAQRLRNATPASRLLRPVLNAVLPDHEITIRVRSGSGAGLELPILPRSEKYYWTGVHERPVQDALAALLRPGMTFWDVGAHIGFFSLIASRLVTETGHVEAFEPFPANQLRLTNSIELNGVTNISVHAVALAEVTGTASFHSSPSSLMGSLLPNERGTSIQVHCVSADDANRSIRPPDVIKIDAEGAELAVLRGASRMLACVRPIIVVELTTTDMLDEVRMLTPDYGCQNVAANHWILEPR
jgi:FkbM family methyltransferase